MPKMVLKVSKIKYNQQMKLREWKTHFHGITESRSGFFGCSSLWNSRGRSKGELISKIDQKSISNQQNLKNKKFKVTKLGKKVSQVLPKKIALLSKPVCKI